MTAQTTPALDEARAERFAERVLGVLNDGALAVMISVGHRTGLLDALAERDEVTSEELAAVARLDERYVREWLAAMTTGGWWSWTRPPGATRSPPSTPAGSRVRPSRRTLPSRRSTSRCWARWRTRSCAASTRGAGSRTRASPASTR